MRHESTPLDAGALGTTTTSGPGDRLRDLLSLTKPRLSALVLFTAGGGLSLAPTDVPTGRAVAAILGTLYTGAAFGNLLGPWAAGAVFDRTGSYLPVIGGCVVGCALATWATLRIGRRQLAT